MCRSCPTVCGCGCGFQKRVCGRCGHYVLGGDDRRAHQDLSRLERAMGGQTAVLGPRPWQWSLAGKE